VFFDFKPSTRPLGRLKDLWSKGYLMSAFTHAGVLYRDVLGIFGAQGRLYSFELNLARGCAVLRPAAARLKRHKVLVRCCVDRDESMRDHVAVGRYIHEQHQQHNRVSFSRYLASLVSVYVTHPAGAPEENSTCADFAMRFLSAAGLANPGELESCTVNDFLYSDGMPGVDPFFPALYIKRWKKTRGRSAEAPESRPRGRVGRNPPRERSGAPKARRTATMSSEETGERPTEETSETPTVVASPPVLPVRVDSRQPAEEEPCSIFASPPRNLGTALLSTAPEEGAFYAEAAQLVCGGATLFPWRAPGIVAPSFASRRE
jgi:hypothetical protein